MKKLLNILFALPLLATPVIGTVACGSKTNNENNENDDYNVYDKDAAKSLKLMSQLVLSGRHENMNFNINELLSNLIMPNQGYGGIPTKFNYNGKSVDYSKQLNDYLSRMAPGIGSLEKKGNDVVGAYASYIMGMYEDKFYQEFQRNGYFNDTLSRTGKTGLYSNGKEEDRSMGILPGLNKDIHLSNDNSRKELAWGIQDNGPLTNYLLEHGYDGAPAVTIANTSAPATSVWDGYIKSGTNAGGYMFYNSNLTGSTMSGGTRDNKFRNGKYISQLTQDKIKEVSDGKLELVTQKANAEDFKNSVLKVPGGEINFNEAGSLVELASGDAYVDNVISNISGLLSSITNSESGINILVRFLDYLLPIRNGYAGPFGIDQSTLINLITSGTYMGFIPDFYETSTGNIKGKILDVLGDDISKKNDLTKSIEKFKDANVGALGLNANGPSLKFMFGDNASSVLKQSQKLFKAIIKKYDSLGSSERVEFVNTLCETLGETEGNQHNLVPTYTAVKSDKKIDIINDIAKKINPKNKKHNLINLLSFSTNMYNLLQLDLDGDNIFNEIVKKANESKEAVKTNGETLISSLSVSELNKIKTLLGVKNGKLDKKSPMKGILDLFTLNPNNDATIGAETIKETVSSVASGIDKKMKNPYDKVLKHVVDNDEWRISNTFENFTSVQDTNAVMSFTLDYTGVGDSKSAADKQTKKLDDSKLNNFNPYQTISKYFTVPDGTYDFNKGFKLNSDAKADASWDHNRVSGQVLGKNLLTDSPDQSKIDEALINYDGLGLLDNYKKVHHRYKVEWKNVGVSNSAYWVMTKVDCFNVSSDGKESQFYNIY